MKTTLQRWGNSQGIRIPHRIIDSLAIEVRADMSVGVSSDLTGITVTPSHETQPIRGRYRIKDLIATSAPGAFEGELDWESSQGKEAW